MENNDNISIFNNEVEPVELRLGSYNPKIPKFNIIPYKDIDIGNENDSDEDEVSIFNAPPPKSTFGIKDTMGKIANTPDFGSSSTRAVEDLSELSDYDVLTGESPYGSGKDDYMYRHQSIMEALGKTAWNAMPNFISGLTMTPSAAYSIADRNFGTDNPYENPLSAVSDWAQEKKYRVWGKDGQLDLSDALGVIEQIPMTLGIMGGTVATLAPAAFVGPELGLGAVAGASLGFGVTVGEVGSAIAMAYAEGRDGARSTFKDKYNQIYKETGNDEYAKHIAETAASVETNTNILLNTALNIIPAKWLLKNNKLKAIDDVLEETGLLNKYKPYQLADESLEEFTDRMRNFTPGTKTNLNRDALDFTGKMSDLAYNVKNPGEFLNRKLDIVGEIFGEGLEEYNNYYAHELAMSINNEKDVQKLNGVLSVPLSQIGSDITNVKILKDMTNNKGLYDFASGAIVSALTSPFMKKFKLNRSKVYNEETGEYEYKYKRGNNNPFKNIPYFEYQNSDYDALDVEQQALNSLKTIDQMNELIESYNSATDMDIKDSYIQQMTNIPLSKHLNQKTINIYNALLDNQIKGLGEKNKSIVNDDVLIDTVSKGLDTSMYSYISAQQKAKLEDNVKKYKDVSALIADKIARGEDVAIHETEKAGFLKEIKDIGSVASKAINKHQTELKTQLDYSKNLAKEYNDTIEYFTKQGVTRDNDYGFVNAYFLNKINNKEESKLHDKVLQKYNTLQKEITDDLIKHNINNYKTKQDAYELLKKKEEILSDEINKKEKERDKRDPNDTIYIDTLTAEINTAKAELAYLRTKEANGKTKIENLVISALKELSDIQSKALSANEQLMEYGNNLTKSRIRLKQYEIENKHLTDSSYGDATDTILQKLHMKIQAHRNGDDLLSAISKYERIAKIIEASGIDIDPLEFGVFTDEEKKTLKRHREFNEHVLEYEAIVDKNQGNKQGHYLSKYFKANKRFVDELEKYEKSKEEVQYYHRQLYRLSEAGDINYYAEFMSIFSNLQRYINEDGNIYNLGKDDMKKAIDSYNRYYQDALNYIDKLEQHYKDLQAADGVSRKMFTDRTESLKYFIMSKTKEIERLSEMYNYKLAQDTQKELSDLYKTIRTNYNPTADKATLKASIELQLSSYKRYIPNYNRIVNMLVNNKDKSEYYDITAVDSTTHYHKYGTHDIYTVKFIEYDTSTNKFEEKEVYFVDGVETNLTLIKLNNTASPLFTNQDNLLLTDELKNIKTNDTVPDSYLFVDKTNKTISYKDLKDFKSIEEKLGNTLSTNLIDIDGTIYYKDVTADYYKIVDNKGELISKDNIIANHSITAPFHLYTPTKSVFLIEDKIYTSNGSELLRNPNTQFYSITDAATNEIKIFTIKNIDDDQLTIEVNYGVNATKNEVIPFSQDIIPTPSKDAVDYIKGMVDFIDDYVNTAGEFDYDKYKSENEENPVHKAIIDLVNELISNNGKKTFYLHTINDKLISPYIDIIRSSKLSSLIKLENNNIDKDYPSKINFTAKVTNTGRLLFNQEIKESNYKTKIDDYIKTINLPKTKQDTQLLDNVLDGITVRLTALKESPWKKDIVYDLYQILKDYNDLINNPFNLKVSYKFEDKGDINVNTTINIIEGSDIVTYKYINHKYILTDTGLKVEVMYTYNGVNVNLDDNDIIDKINNKTVRPIILTLSVGKDLKTTPETLNRITVKNDTITSIPLNSNNLQHNHSFELFTNNGNSKMLIIKGKQVNIDKATNPTLFDSTSLSQARTSISKDNIIQLKRLIALFSIDTDGNSVDVYNDILGGVINDSIISAFINTTFGSKDVFERIAIDVDKVTFNRRVTTDFVIDTVNDVEYKYPIEKPIINTGATGSSTIVPENIIPTTERIPIVGDILTSVSGTTYIITGFLDTGGIKTILPKDVTKGLAADNITAKHNFSKKDFDDYIKSGKLKYNTEKSELEIKIERIEKERNKALVAARPKSLGLDVNGNLIEVRSGARHELDFSGAFTGGILEVYQQIFDALVANTIIIAGLLSSEVVQLKPLYNKGLIKSKVDTYHRINEPDINAKYDKLIEDLYNEQPTEPVDNIDESITDTNDEFLRLQEQITEIKDAKNKLIEKAIGDIRGVVKIPNYRLNINENSSLYAQRYVEDKDTWENYNVEAKTIISLFGAENWKKIVDIHNAFYKEFRTNGYAKKEAAIVKQQFDLLSTPTGLELRRAWSFGKIDEPSILKLTSEEYIILEEDNGKDIYIGYYYLPTNESDIRAEEVIGDSIQEVKDKLNAKYDAELAALEGNKSTTNDEYKLDYLINKTPIKAGVEELFDSNPELVNQVYEALGFGQENNTEVQKAEIERRRQEELKQVKPLSFSDNEIKQKQENQQKRIDDAKEIISFGKTFSEALDNIIKRQEELNNTLNKRQKEETKDREVHQYTKEELESQPEYQEIKRLDKLINSINEVYTEGKSENFKNSTQEALDFENKELEAIPSKRKRNNEEIGKIHAKYDAELVELNLKKEQLTLSSIDALKANIESRRDIDLTKEITGLETVTEFDSNPVVININNKHDEEYLKAVEDKKITKIEALQALISVNRKGSDTYNKLLKDLVQEKINEAMVNQKGDVTYLIKNNDKIISTDSLNDIDINYDITIEVTVLPPVDLSIPDEFDMLLEEPYEYISEALLNKDFPTVADNSNHHKESLQSSVLNTNTDINYRVPIDINYTIIHSEEHKKAYKKGLNEKLHNNTGINNVTLGVLPVTISYSKNGVITETSILNTKKEQYEFYYGIFSKLSTLALEGYIKQMKYNILDDILDSDDNPLFDFKFSDVEANREKIINFLANLKINYVFMSADNDSIYGSLHDYAYLLSEGIRVKTTYPKAISSLKILRDTAQQHEDNLANGMQSNKPIYKLSYENNGYIRIFKDFSTTPPSFIERDNLYYNSKIALAHQVVEPFKIYLSRTKTDTDRELKYNQDNLTNAIEDMSKEELVSIYRLLLYKANKVLKLGIPFIPADKQIDSNTLNTWIMDNLMPKISGNFIIYGAKITNNISKEKSHMPLYTIKFKELLSSSELTIDDKFVGDEVKVKVGDTKKEIVNYHNNLTQAIGNILNTDKKTVLNILSNFANIDIVFKDVDTWAKKLANSPFEGTSIAVFNSHTTDELTLYLYSNIKNEKGEDVKTLTSISYKQGSKPLVNNSTYMSSINVFAKPEKVVLQSSQLLEKFMLEKFMNAYLSADVTADNSNENILLRTITHVNGLNDELFVNPLLKIEDTNATKTVAPIIVTTDNSNTSDIELPTELLAIQGLIDLYEEFMVEEKRKDKSYVVSSGFSTTIKPHNEVAEKIEDVYKLIGSSKEIKTLVNNYISFINNIIHKKEFNDTTNIHDINILKLFVKKEGIYYINGKYNSNDLKDDIDTLKSFKIDKDIQDCI